MFHNLAHTGFALHLDTTIEAQDQIKNAHVADAQEAERLRAERVKLFKRNSREAHDLAVYPQQGM